MSQLMISTRQKTAKNGSFFWDTLSEGKKYYGFHNVCLTYLIMYRSAKRQHSGQPHEVNNIIPTDNYPNQYKCHQNF